MLFEVVAKGKTVFSDQCVSDLSQEWADVMEKESAAGQPQRRDEFHCSQEEPAGSGSGHPHE